jgi:hydrogenase expression/formation protein HypC
MSRLHRVIDVGEEGRVSVIDLEGREHVVSLLALDGDVPTVGEWLVVHSGYAIDRVDANEAQLVADEITGVSQLPYGRK